MEKEEFIKRFVEDQTKYRSKGDFYKHSRGNNGRVYFNNSQHIDILNRYAIGESMASVGRSYGCNYKVISRYLEEVRVKK